MRRDGVIKGRSGPGIRGEFSTARTARTPSSTRGQSVARVRSSTTDQRGITRRCCGHPTSSLQPAASRCDIIFVRPRVTSGIRTSSIRRTYRIRQFMKCSNHAKFLRCALEEAVEFYCRTIDRRDSLFMMRFRDCPDPSQLRPGMEEKIFHATFRIGSTEIMASDCGCEKPLAETTLQAYSLERVMHFILPAMGRKRPEREAEVR